MDVQRICFLDTRTAHFDATAAFFKDVLGLEYGGSLAAATRAPALPTVLSNARRGPAWVELRLSARKSIAPRGCRDRLAAVRQCPSRRVARSAFAA